MIFGDPYKFAIQFDFVDAWALPDEGIFNLIINGYYQPNLLPNQSVTILDCYDSLNVRYFYLNKKKIFMNIFYWDSDEIYSYMTKIIKRINLDKSKDFEEDIFEFSKLSIPETILDKKYNWLFYSENQEKIIFLNHNNSPSEIILEKGYCCAVINQALLWAKKHYINESRFSKL